MSAETPADPSPAPPPRPATRPITRSSRPATRPVPPSPAKGSKLRLVLMVGIIVSIVVLGALVAWRLYVALHKEVKEPVNVPATSEAAYTAAEKVSREIIAIETKIWTKNEALTPEDLQELKAKVKALEAEYEVLENLLLLLHNTPRGDESQEKVDVLARWLKVKFWINDTRELAFSTPPDWKGLTVPMQLEIRKAAEAMALLKEIQGRREDLIKKGDARELAEAAQRVGDCQGVLGNAAAKFSALEEYIQDLLGQGRLSPSDLKELGVLREEGTAASQAVSQARTLKGQLKP